MSLKENDIFEESKKEAEDEKPKVNEDSEECEFCEGQGWYWLGQHDNMWKEKCECQKEPMTEDDDGV